MKKGILLTLFTAITLYSCGDADPEIYNPADGSIAYFTAGTTGAFFIQEVPNPEHLIEVGITTTSTSDRTFNITVDPESTATANQYTIDQTTLVIPANSNVGYIKILGNYENASTTGSKLILNLEYEVSKVPSLCCWMIISFSFPLKVNVRNENRPLL